MIPYFIYPLRTITKIRIPEILTNNQIGLLMFFVFALIAVIFTGWLEKNVLN